MSTPTTLIFSDITDYTNVSTYQDIPSNSTRTITLSGTDLTNWIFTQNIPTDTDIYGNIKYHLVSVTIGSLVTTINSACFAGEQYLLTLNLNNATSLTTIAINAFNGCIRLADNLVMPSTVNNIALGAFSSCQNLKSIDLSNTNITNNFGESAFSDCYKLTYAYLPPQLTVLPERAFENCNLLTQITIPSTVTTLETDIFSFSGLQSITFENVANITTYPTPLNLFTGVKDINGGINISINFNSITNSTTTNFITSLSNTATTNNYIINYSNSNNGSSGSSGSVPTYNICFSAGTKILTDQGLFNIENLENSNCTIRGFKIEGITKTILSDDSVILIKKDALSPNVPNINTLISNNHIIFYKGKMYKAKDLLSLIKGVEIVKYTGYYMYNVILEKYDYMIANNLFAETLHPLNPICKLFTNKMIKH